jgi:hypothetical protein
LHALKLSFDFEMSKVGFCMLHQEIRAYVVVQRGMWLLAILVPAALDGFVASMIDDPIRFAQFDPN